MKTNWSSGLLLGWLAVGQLLAADPADPADPAGPVPGITVRLVNSAKVPQAEMLEGERVAAYILGKAGIVLTWQDCSTDSAGPCASGSGTAGFWMHVATWKPAAADGEMLGFTATGREPGTDGRLAGVYYPMVRSLSESLGVEKSQILGAALAHEIGHLLGEGHSPTGVMRTQFGRSHIVQASGGGLLFSTLQASQIRAEVTRRKAASDAP